MKIIIAGGTGFLGQCLTDHFDAGNNEIVILSRATNTNRPRVRYAVWDGKTTGDWAHELEGADVLINLNGKSVDCRYTERNKELIYSTRLDATAILGTSVQQCKVPPRVWINAASATIYRHSLDREMDEETGELGSGFSVDVCQRWEALFNSFAVPGTRKILLRTSIVLGRKMGALSAYTHLCRMGLGGAQGPGNQFISWLHEKDFAGITAFLIGRDDARGAYNTTAPNPIRNRDFMHALRKAMGMPFGIPMGEMILTAGAGILGTETELVLKSRRVVPKRLLSDGYHFQFSDAANALKDLV